MREQDFVKVRDMVYDACGIVLGEHKREMVYSRLARRIRHYQFTDFATYLSFLENNKEQEFEEFLNSVTTNLTSFFRERHHFEFLKKTIVPEIKKRHRIDHRVRIWSAGCSTGEEPYSIAMQVASEFSGAQWDFKILATDLDTNVLAKASNGVYDIDGIKEEDKALCRKHFLFDKSSQQIKAKAELKECIFFKQLNLLTPWPMSQKFDVIFCRNVVIYFDQPTKDKLMKRYAERLVDGGYLILGHSETMSKSISEFEPLGKTIYRKVCQA